MSHNPSIKFKRKDGKGYWSLNHESLPGLLGGEDDDHYHVTGAEHSGLVDGNLTELHRHYAFDVDLARMAASTYATLQEFVDTTGSGGLISGGTITDAGSGTIDVAAGTAMIRTADSDNAEIKFVDFSAVSGMAIDDDALNNIYVDYNGGSPTIGYATDFYTTATQHTKIIIGFVYRDDNDLHIIASGQHAHRWRTRLWLHHMEETGFHRVDGMVTSHTGTRNMAITAGVAYYGFNRLTTPAFDSSGTDTFSAYYRNGSGGWTLQTGQTALTDYWDDNTGVLNDLTVLKYGVHWIYMVTDGDVYTVYGRGDYTLAQAEAATPPADLPGELANIGMFVAKVIIQEGSSDFEEVYLPWIQSIGFSTATDHGGLAGLGDQEDHTWALTLDGSRTMTGDLAITKDAPAIVLTDDGGLVTNLRSTDSLFAIEIDPTDSIASSQLVVYIDGGTSLSVGSTSTTIAGNAKVVGGYLSITAAASAPALAYMYADAGTADEDRWVLRADVDATLAIQNHATGSWVDLLELTSAGLLSLNGTIGVDSILDQDDFYSDSDTALATQQSIKAYIDGEITGLSIGDYALLDASNQPFTGSIEIDQGTNDGTILALASTGDIDHGCTGWAPTNQFGLLAKRDPDSGGLLVHGLADTGTHQALILRGFSYDGLGTLDDGTGVINLQVALIDGTDIASTITADGLLASIQKVEAGPIYTTVFSVREDGKIWSPGIAETAGLILDQGSDTGHILDLQASYVDQPATTRADADTYFFIHPVGASAGGASIWALSDDDTVGLRFTGVVGSTSANNPPVLFRSAKSDGSDDVAALAADEVAYRFDNWTSSQLVSFYGNGNVTFAGSLTLGSTELTETDLGDLLDGGATTLHKHDHGNLDGLSDNDHPQYVLNSLFDANTVLYATSDNTPVALSVAEQRLVGRLTGGNISAVTIGIADNNIVQMDDADATDNDYAKFTANGLEGRSYAEVLGDLSGQANANFSFGSYNVTADAYIAESTTPLLKLTDTAISESIQLWYDGNVLRLAHYDNPDWNYLLSINDDGTLDVTYSEIVLDEDDMASDSAVKVPTQQSVKAYVDQYGAILTSNGTYRGKTLTVTVDDASAAFGNVLAQAADFHYDRADADAAANSVGLVLCIDAGSGTKEVLIEGMACNTSWTWSAGTLYLSTTTGEMVQTAPSGTGDQVVAVGWALSATCIFFKPSLVLVEVA